jgi:hypothetical protein
MHYHACINLSGKDYWWPDLDFDSLIQIIVVPYINKQVVSATLGKKRLILNLFIATYISIYKTPDKFDGYSYNDESGSEKPNIAGYDVTNEIVKQFLLTKSPEETKSLLQTLFSPTVPQVFIIMKFKDKLLDSAYDGVIKPIIKRFKYRPLRIDEVQDSGRITNQILEEIAKSEIVLADLTGERPNCYYEAGFAHAIGKEMIFTIHKGSSIHFDLSGYRFIEWETEYELRRELSKRFKAIRQKKEKNVRTR